MQIILLQVMKIIKSVIVVLIYAVIYGGPFVLCMTLQNKERAIYPILALYGSILANIVHNRFIKWFNSKLKQ